MKNLKILIFAALIGIASIGCADEGGKKKKTPGAVATASDFSSNARSIADNASLVALAVNNSDVTSSANKLSEHADVIGNDQVEDAEHGTALLLFVAELKHFLTLPHINDSALASELQKLGNTFITDAELFIKESSIVAPEVTEPAVEEETPEAPAEVETPEDIIEELEEVIEDLEDIIEEIIQEEIDTILNPGETCPEETETEIHTCTTREDVLLLKLDGELCPEDSDTEHYTCKYASSTYDFLHGDTITITSSNFFGVTTYYGGIGGVSWKLAPQSDGTFEITKEGVFVSDDNTITFSSTHLEIETADGDAVIVYLPDFLL